MPGFSPGAERWLGASFPISEVIRGFVPGRRAPFVSAKVTKTMDAPSGLFGREGREPFAERPNSPGSNKGRQIRRASLPGASRQASEVNHENFRDR